MTKKSLSYFSLLIILSLSLFLSGCTTDSGDRSSINFRTGSQALELQMVNPGLETFFEGDSATILLEVFNRGTADIVGGELFVSGYDPSFMRLQVDPKYITMDGKSEFDPTGRSSVIHTISSSDLSLPTTSERFDQNLKVTACYEYRTETTADLCIDPDPNGRRVSGKLCTMSSVSPGAQGAPLVVTRVEPIVVREDLRLNIEFSNQGNGVIFDRRLNNAECFGSLDRYTDANKIDLIEVEFSGRNLYCEPVNPLRLLDGRGRVTCTCEGCINDLMDAFKTQISIVFSYGYRNEIIKPIRVLAE